jgi:aminopeptidase
MSSFATSTANFSALSFNEKLDRFAEVSIRIGLGLEPGQELVLTAPTDALPLVRRVTEHAYRAGAKLVTTFYSDDAAILARYQFAPNNSFDYAPTWYHDAIATAFRSGAARMGITGANPALLAQQDPTKVSRANVASSSSPAIPHQPHSPSYGTPFSLHPESHPVIL